MDIMEYFYLLAFLVVATTFLRSNQHKDKK
jgi:hypothetical protein